MTSLKRVIAVATVGASLLLMAGPAFAVTAEELLAQIQALQEQLAQLQAQYEELVGEEAAPAAIEGCTISSFDRNLKQGMSGDDVKCLQIVLNSDPDTQLAESGVGSPGNETNYFGPLTKAAVIKFQEKYSDDVLAPWGLTSGTGFVGSTTRAKLNELLTAAAPVEEEEEVPVEEEEAVAPGLTVELAEDTPVSGTVVAGQAAAELAKFVFTNGDDSAVKVTTLKLTRIGVSADATLSSVYLYEGTTRLTDSASVSSGVITFNNSAGIFTVAAGSSVTITVKSNIATGTSGQTLGVSINAASDVTTDASSVNGDFPLQGNLMSVASATLATLDLNSTTTPSASASIDPGTMDYTVWKNITTVGTRAVYLKLIRLRMIGSVEADDLQNFRFYVNGVQKGDAIETLDSDNYVTFDLTANPVELETGNRTLEVRADIIGGANREFSFSLRQAVDLVVTDSQYDVTILPTVGSSTFTPCTTATISINTGSLTVEKVTLASPYVIKDGSNVTLAKYTLTAYGEDIKVESLKVQFIAKDSGGNDKDSIGELRNGALYADGVQVGSTADILEDSNGAGYTSYSLGSSLIVQPGSPVTLEVRADIYDSDGTNNIASGDQLQIKLVAGSNNAQAQTSLTLLNVPSATKAADTLTVQIGSVTLSKNTTLADQNIIQGSSNVKIASFALTAGPIEEVTVTSLTVSMSSADAAKITSLTISESSTVHASPSTSNNFSTSIVLSPNEQKIVDVTASVKTTATGTIHVSMSGVYTTASGQSGTLSDTSGQTMTIVTSGTLSVAKDPDSPIAQQIVMGQTNVELARFRFTANNNEDLVISRVTIEDNTSYPGSLQNFKLYDVATGTQLGSTITTLDSNNRATFGGLSVTVSKGGSKTLAVKADVSSYPTGTSAGTHQIRIPNVSTAIAYTGVSSGETKYLAGSPTSANTMTVYRAKISVAYASDSPSGKVLMNGTGKLIAKFVVSNESPGGYIATLKKFKITVDQSGATASNLAVYKNSITASNDLNYSASDGDIDDVEISADSSVTLLVTATISGADQTGDSISPWVDSGDVTWSDGVTATITSVDSLPTIPQKTLTY